MIIASRHDLYILIQQSDWQSLTGIKYDKFLQGLAQVLCTSCSQSAITAIHTLELAFFLIELCVCDTWPLDPAQVCSLYRELVSCLAIYILALTAICQNRQEIHNHSRIVRADSENMGVSHATVIKNIKASWAQTAYAQIIIFTNGVHVFLIRLQEWIVWLSISTQSAILYFVSFQASWIWGSPGYNHSTGGMMSVFIWLSSNCDELFNWLPTFLDHVEFQVFKYWSYWSRLWHDCIVPWATGYWLKQIDLCDIPEQWPK